MKKYKVSLITLIITFIIAVCSLAVTLTASAARVIDLNGSTVFYAVNGASVTAYRETVGQTATDYAMFSLGEESDKVTFRKNLAYSWYEKDANAVGAQNQGKNVMFNLELGFDGVNFERFSVKFESQQANKTEKGVSVNYVTFVKVATDKVSVIIGDDDNAQVVSGANQYAVKDSNGNPTKFVIEFVEYADGGYTVKVSNGNAEQTGRFENVGGTYAKYVSSSNKNPVTPLTFAATFADGATAPANMVLYSMNGQSFKLSNVNGTANGNLTSGQVEDNAAPVVCFNETVSFLEFGEEIDLDYTVIDVLASSPRATVYYYVLNAQMASNANFGYNVTVKEAEGDDNLTSPFSKVTTSDNIIMLESDYLPQSLVNANDGFKAYALAKVYLNVTDVLGSNGVANDVFVDWYVDGANLKYNVNGSDFMMVATDDEGVSYASQATNNAQYLAGVESFENAYQAEIDALSANQKLYAGSQNYVYLPSLENYFADNFDAYEDLTFSIYYYNSAQRTNTGLKSSELAINIAEEGFYTFTVFATDRAENKMWYIDADGELKEFASSEIWTMYGDDELSDYLPWFTFEVDYKSATIEEVESRPSGYVGTTYDDIEFEINGIANSYETAYYLYLFDRDAYTAEVGAITYKEFVEKVDELYADPDTFGYFTTIKALADMEEGDPYYDKFKAYKWNKTSLSFVPQDDNSFYAVRLTVTDVNTSEEVTKLMAIRVSAKADALMGENEWLKNNITSIVLFCISGACAVAIVVLLAVKPKNVDLDALDVKTGKKNKK